MEDIVKCLALALVLSLSFIGCSVMGHAVGDRMDGNKAENDVLVMKDIEPDTIADKLENLKGKLILITTINNESYHAILNSYAVGKYLDVVVDSNSLISSSQSKRVKWEELEIISHQYNKKSTYRTTMTLFGAVVDAVVVFMLINSIHGPIGGS